MRIGELAQRSELTASRIRFYEAHGLLPKPERRDNGYRDYSDDVVDMLRLIHDAQALGFSLTEIKSGPAKAGNKRPSADYMLEALREKLTSLDQHIAEVEARRAQIVEFIKEFETEC